MTVLELVRRTDQGLVVTIASVDTLLSWRWLRDHGEDETSFDATTKQRRVYALDTTPPQPALAAELSTVAATPVVSLTWPEAPAQTWISQATLRSLLAPLPSQPLPTWHRASDTDVAKGDVAAVLSDDEALRVWVSDIVRFGYGFLGGFSGGHDEVTALAARIGPPMSTIFGTTWDLASDVALHDDTAYTQSFLAPHTDGTYLHHAPRLQMFCCTERDGTGGESTIVDAFALAETLRDDDPDAFDVLASVSVPGHYLEAGVELRTTRPAIRLDDDGAVAQVSMNNYDRSPMLLPADEMAAFYRAYGRLHELANDRTRWQSIRLAAGDVLINDNWRVLHGREAYAGGRRFVGCYLNHEDFESRARVLGLRQNN